MTDNNVFYPIDLINNLKIKVNFKILLDEANEIIDNY